MEDLYQTEFDPKFNTTTTILQLCDYNFKIYSENKLSNATLASQFCLVFAYFKEKEFEKIKKGKYW